MTRKKAPAASITRADVNKVIDTARALEPDAMRPADLFPLSQRATPGDLSAAGIANGMPPEEVEARLSKVMT